MMFPTVHGLAGAERPKLIDILTGLSLTTNLKLCLDAGDGNSADGGAKWLDVAGAGNDFFLGATGSAETDDPTFNGSVGGGGAGEHWSFDGGDMFKYDSGNEVWMNALHKNNALWTVFSLLNVPTAGAGWFGDNASTLGEVGMFLHIGTGDDKPRLIVSKLGGEAVLTKDADNAISLSVWHMLGCSIDEAAGSGGGFLYKDGAFDQVGASDTFDPGGPVMGLPTGDPITTVTRRMLRQGPVQRPGWRSA